MPERLKEIVGKREIKISLRTCDRTVARIRCLEELVKIERAWSGIDAAIIDGADRVLAPLQSKVAPDAPSPDGRRPSDWAPADASAIDPGEAAGSEAHVPLRPLRSCPEFHLLLVRTRIGLALYSKNALSASAGTTSSVRCLRILQVTAFSARSSFAPLPCVDASGGAMSSVL